VQQPAAAQIDNSNAIVFELGDKQMLARRIEREMVDAAIDRPKWDLVLQFEKSRAVLLRDARASGHSKHQDNCQQSQQSLKFLQRHFTFLWLRQSSGPEADGFANGVVANLTCRYSHLNCHPHRRRAHGQFANRC